MDAERLKTEMPPSLRLTTQDTSDAKALNRDMSATP